MLSKAQSGQMFSEVPTHVLGNPVEGVQSQQGTARSIRGTLIEEVPRRCQKPISFLIHTRRCESLSSGNLLPNTDG